MDEPLAWLHELDNTEGLSENEPVRRLTFSLDNPFGIPGQDYDEEFTVTSIPLYSLIDLRAENQQLRAELDSTEMRRIKLHELLQALHEWFVIQAPGDYKPSTLYRQVQMVLTQPARDQGGE